MHFNVEKYICQSWIISQPGLLNKCYRTYCALSMLENVDILQNLNMKKHWLINNILCEKLNSAKNLGVSSASVQRPLMNNFACSCLHMVPVNKLNDESQCFPRLRRIPYQCILFLHSRIIGSVPSSTGISGAAPLRMTNYDVITPVHS